MSPARCWAERWVGREYIPGRYECGDFVQEVLAEQFGLQVELPRGVNVRDRDRLVAGLRDELAEPVAPPGAERDGDAVLMRARGRRSEIGHHIGLWCAPGAMVRVPSVLHCQRGLGACIHPINQLSERGLEFVGVYRWKR